MNSGKHRRNLELHRDRSGQTTGQCRSADWSLRTILDGTIVVLMVAILLTLSLPICMAVVEQKAVEQTLNQGRAG